MVQHEASCNCHLCRGIDILLQYFLLMCIKKKLAQGKIIYFAYKTYQRLQKIWAKNKSTEGKNVTFYQKLIRLGLECAIIVVVVSHIESVNRASQLHHCLFLPCGTWGLWWHGVLSKHKSNLHLVLIPWLKCWLLRILEEQFQIVCVITEIYPISSEDQNIYFL